MFWIEAFWAMNSNGSWWCSCSRSARYCAAWNGLHGHGHHVYKSVWSPVIEQLILKKVPANPHNEFAVPVIGASQIVSHIPKNYSQITCGILLYTQRGSVVCHITGRRRKGKVLEVSCKCIYYYDSTKTQHLFIFAIVLFPLTTKRDQAFIRGWS